MAHAETHDHAGHDHSHAGPHHGPSHYLKIWGLLCALLVVSIVGPMFGHKLLTLITAFGIAIVKAWMVASYFMHLNIEKKFASLLLLTMIAALVVFWYGISPDIRMHQGKNWENRAVLDQIEKHSHDVPEGHGEPGEHGGAPPPAGEHP